MTTDRKVYNKLTRIKNDELVIIDTNIDTLMEVALVTDGIDEYGQIVATTNHGGYGSYSEVTSSTTTKIAITGFEIRCSSEWDEIYRVTLSLGTGASGSEVVKAIVSKHIKNPDSESSIQWRLSTAEHVFPIPLIVESGTRIAIKVKDTASAYDSEYAFYIHYVEIN